MVNEPQSCNVDILKQAANFFKYDYYDRGMMKWQGYYLSDHTEQVQKTAQALKRANERSRSSEMSPILMSKILFEAYAQHESVAIQLNTQSVNGVIPQMITGHVMGYTDEAVIIGDHHVPWYQLWSVQK